MSDAGETGGFHPGHSPWTVAFTVTLATFMEVLDTNIANVSLPHIAGNLSVDQTASTWVLTSYLVSNAIVLPISAWASGRIGRKRFYMSCVALFTVSSFLCGIAPNLGTLIFFRILQGAGGGGLGPSEQSILADTFPERQRGQAFAMYGMAVVLAPAIGPTLGGFITDNFSWRWVFFINVPVGIVSLLLTSRIVDDPPWLKERRPRTAIDYVGLGLIIVSLGTLQVVLDKGQQEDWFNSRFITTFVVICAIGFVLLVFWELDHAHPIVDLRMLKNRNFALSNLMMGLLAMVLFGSTVLLPQYLQTVLDYSAEQAGLILSPGGVVLMLLMPLVGYLVSRVDPRYLIVFGFVESAVALFYMAGHLYLGIDFRTAVHLRIYQAVGLAFLFIPINTISYIGVPPQKNNEVSSFLNFSRNMGGSIGIALISTGLVRRAQTRQSALVMHLQPQNLSFGATKQWLTLHFAQTLASQADATTRALGRMYQELSRQALVLAYDDVIRLLAMAVALAAPLPLLLQKRRPGERVVMH